MPSLNKWSVIGNLGRDAELRYTATGKAQATFTVATSRRVKGDNEYEEVTEWVRVVWFSEQAPKLVAFMLKGSQVFVDGRHQTRKWEDENGKHEVVELIASDVQLLTSKASTESPAGYTVNQMAEASLDDLPF